MVIRHVVKLFVIAPVFVQNNVVYVVVDPFSLGFYEVIPQNLCSLFRNVKHASLISSLKNPSHILHAIALTYSYLGQISPDCQNRNGIGC